MKPLFHPRLLPALLLLCAPAAFVSGCGGGGGGGPVAPTPARTPTASPTPSPTPVTAFIGTYSGTYNFPAMGASSALSGPFVLRVQADGTATGNLNEDQILDIITTSGTTSLSNGQVSLSGTYDGNNSGAGMIGSYLPTTLMVAGTANSVGASGTLVTSNSLDGARNGTFTTTKTSPSPTAVPTPEPTSTSPLVRKASASEHRLLPHRRSAN